VTRLRAAGAAAMKSSEIIAESQPAESMTMVATEGTARQWHALTVTVRGDGGSLTGSAMLREIGRSVHQRCVAHRRQTRRSVPGDGNWSCPACVDTGCYAAESCS
jgi:hypothetical protein